MLWRVFSRWRQSESSFPPERTELGPGFAGSLCPTTQPSPSFWAWEKSFGRRVSTLQSCLECWWSCLPGEDLCFFHSLSKYFLSTSCVCVRHCSRLSREQNRWVSLPFPWGGGRWEINEQLSCKILWRKAKQDNGCRVLEDLIQRVSLGRWQLRKAWMKLEEHWAGGNSRPMRFISGPNYFTHTPFRAMSWPDSDLLWLLFLVLMQLPPDQVLGRLFVTAGSPFHKKLMKKSVSPPKGSMWSTRWQQHVCLHWLQFSHSVVSDSLWPHGLQPTRLLRPWVFPGKSIVVGCHCLLCLRCFTLSYFIMVSEWPCLRLIGE